MVALIEKELSLSTALQLERSADPLWVNGSVRKSVRDMIDATSTPNHIVINPHSNPAYPIQLAGAFDGKAVIYAAFNFAQDEFISFYPGRHEVNLDFNIPRTLKAVSFRTDQNGRWHCFRIQNRGLVEIKFKNLDGEDPDPYEVYLHDNYQNRHDMIDLVMQGGYADIDLSDAPQLYKYFLSLLSMEPNEARATAEKHEENRIASNVAYRKSTNVAPADSFTIDGERVAADVVKEMGRLQASHKELGYTFGVSARNLPYLTELAEEGYTLSRPS